MERIRQTNETRIFVSFLNNKLATKINNIIVNKEPEFLFPFSIIN
jgi:hypothetical protein